MQEFSEVYESCKDNIWKLISRYVSIKEDREDLFQEIFLNIHKALKGFRGESAVSTWAYRIAVNTAINHVKKRNRYKLLTQMLGNFRETKVEEIGITIDEEVSMPLEKLNPQQRMIFVLAEAEEMKLDEIASMLKMPVGTIKSNLHRAREIIKKEVSKYGEI